MPTRPNAFSPEFLEQLHDSPEPLTAAEADLAGPWKVEAIGGPPGAFAVLREWESLERGDEPEAVFLDKETARLCAAVLCLIAREPLFQLDEEPSPGAPVAGGYPVAASLLNISRQAAYKRYRAGRLIAIDCGRHGLAFPAWQFVPGGVLPGHEQVLTLLADLDPWMKLAFFLEPNAATGGKTPLAALRGGKLKDVLRAAELHGEHGAV